MNSEFKPDVADTQLQHLLDAEYFEYSKLPIPSAPT